MIQEVKCVWCGERFLRKNVRKVCCSERCRKQKARAEEAADKRPKRYRKTCPCCGKTFEGGRYQKYCSVECRGQVQSREAHKKPPKVKIRITAEIPVWPELRPVPGQEYEAERCQLIQRCVEFWIIEIGGKRIVVRKGEAVEV